MLRRIVYRGAYVDLTPSADLADILSSARRRNACCEVTGLPWFDDGRFLQVLEGEEEVLYRLLDEIKLDARNRQVTLIQNDPITTRLFTSWAMASAPFDEIQVVYAHLREVLRSIDPKLGVYEHLHGFLVP